MLWLVQSGIEGELPVRSELKERKRKKKRRRRKEERTEERKKERRKEEEGKKERNERKNQNGPKGKRNSKNKFNPTLWYIRSFSTSRIPFTLSTVCSPHKTPAANTKHTQRE